MNHARNSTRNAPMKNKIFLLAILLCTACGLNKQYAIYQYDNGDDYVKDGTIRIVDIQSKKIGYATPDGKVLIEPQFSYGYPFENGIAKVTYKGKQKVVDNSQGEYHYWDSDDWFYIDKQGNKINQK